MVDFSGTNKKLETEKILRLTNENFQNLAVSFSDVCGFAHNVHSNFATLITAILTSINHYQIWICACPAPLLAALQNAPNNKLQFSANLSNFHFIE